MKRDDDSIPFGKEAYEEGLSQLANDLTNEELRSAHKSLIKNPEAATEIVKTFDDHLKKLYPHGLDFLDDDTPMSAFRPYQSDPETLARLDAMIRPDLNDEQFKEHLERVYAIRRKDPAVRGPAMTAIGSLGYFGGLPARGLMMPGGGFHRGEFISLNAFVAPELQHETPRYRFHAEDMKNAIGKQYALMKQLAFKPTNLAKKINPLAGLTHTTDYYKQSRGGGYEKQWTGKFTNVPRVLKDPYLYPEVCTSTRMVNHSSEGPYVRIHDHSLLVGGIVVKDWKRFPDYQHIGDKYYYACMDSITEMARNDLKQPRDKEGYLKDPLPRNHDREEWVDKAMWEMGMSRSRYRPGFKERHPHVNVGTIGHADQERVLYYTGKSYSGR